MDFLQPITVKGKLRRRSRVEKQDKYPFHKHIKEWQYDVLRDPIQGIVIGKRTLSNGHTRYEDEVGNTFYPESYFKAFLVATDMNTKPFYIPESEINEQRILPPNQ